MSPYHKQKTPYQENKILTLPVVVPNAHAPLVSAHIATQYVTNLIFLKTRSPLILDEVGWSFQLVAFSFSKATQGEVVEDGRVTSWLGEVS